MNVHLENMESVANPEGVDARIQDFYENYFSLVRTYILNNSGDLEDAKDIFQEVAFAFFKQRSKLDPSAIENERNYVMGIARNTWLKKLRQTKNVHSTGTEFLENVSDMPPDESELKKDDLIDVVLRKLQEMNEECRKIIHAAFYLKLSTVEIAVHTGYSEKFVKVKKFRCLQALRKLVTGSTDFRNVQMQ